MTHMKTPLSPFSGLVFLAAGHFSVWRNNKSIPKKRPDVRPFVRQFSHQNAYKEMAHPKPPLSPFSGLVFLAAGHFSVWRNNKPAPNSCQMFDHLFANLATRTAIMK